MKESDRVKEEEVEERGKERKKSKEGKEESGRVWKCERSGSGGKE